MNKKEKNINIKSAKDSPDCLLKIVDYLNSYKLKVCEEHEDGRIGSVKDENSCIEALKKCNEFNVVSESVFDETNCDNKITIVVPKAREWFDIRVVYDNKSYYVNIKSSTLKSKDNVGCVDEIMFGLFGQRKYIKDKTKKYSILFEEYNKYKEIGFSDIEDYNYYFLIINKNNIDGCFITSLCHMNEKSISPNGSNPPFQCKWDNNSMERSSKEYICDLIMNVICQSLEKPAEILYTDALVTFRNTYKK